jgi:predicted CopG family antitoxin
MKTINVVFETEEYKRLIEKKGSLSWHDFIMTLAEGN